MKYTLGSDPEVLLHDGQTFVSAIGKIPGTKEAPALVQNGIVHHDNVCGEFGTTPVGSPVAFDNVVGEVYQQVEDIVSSVKLTISRESVGEFSTADLAHPLAKQAGCMPDWNVYTGEINPPPDYTATNIRCAGGHIHIGTSVPRHEHVMLIGALDMLITIPMLEHDNATRRHLYGKAGAYRLKDYGIEYRTPSNFWIFTSERRRWVAEMVERAIKEYSYMPVPPNLQSVINGHDVTTAKEWIDMLGLTPCPV